MSVFWINAETHVQLMESYLQVAKACNLPLPPDGSTTWADVSSRVKRRLENQTFGNWLMVFDNVDDPWSFPFYDIPWCPHGRLLFTSRASGFQGRLQRGRTIEVTPMSTDQGAAFLTAMMQRRHQGDQTTAPTQTAAVKKVVQLLGGHPLALAHAAAFMDTSSSSVAEYLDSFQRHEDRHLRLRMDVGQRYRGYESLQSIWNITFQEIEQQSPGAFKVLLFMAVVAPDNIPRSFLNAAVPDKLEFVEAMSSLLRYSLVKRSADGDFYTIHRLIQAQSRAVLKEKGQLEETATQVIRVLDNQIVPRESQEWRTALALLPHVECALAATSESAVDKRARALLIIKVTPYWIMLGRLDYAKKIASEAVKLLKNDQSGNFEAFLTLGHVLLHVAQEEYINAGDLADICLNLSEQQYGPESEKVADALSLRGSVLRQKGLSATAVEVYRRELSIRKSVGTGTVQLYSAFSGLGCALDLGGDYKSAEELHRQALEGKTRLLGRDHPDTGICMANLAIALHGQGLVEDSLQLLENALSILHDTLGAENPETLRVSARLAGVKKDFDDSLHRKTSNSN